MTRLFLDANVYFAGFFSPEGASSLILELARRKKLGLVATKLVLREADRNLRKKSPPEKLKAFHRFLQETTIDIRPAPTEKSMAPYEPHIPPKDLPVLAAAAHSDADFLVTLDKKHFLAPQVLSKVKKPKIFTPADFICEVYPKGKT